MSSILKSMLGGRSGLRCLVADRDGVVAVLVALAATVLLGFVGLAVDVGNWEFQQRKMQSAADEAAFAAATAANNSVAKKNAYAIAMGVAKQMGFDSGYASVCATGSEGACCGASATSCSHTGSGSNPATVTVYNPPPSGSYSGTSNAFQVSIQQTQQRWFTQLFMTSAPTAGANSIAALSSTSTQAGACTIALDNSNDGGAMTVDGTATLNNCDAYVNSSDSQALKVQGSGSMTVSAAYVSGNESSKPSALTTGTNGYHYSQATVSDPYHSTSGSCAAGAWVSSNTASSSCRMPPSDPVTDAVLTTSSCPLSATQLNSLTSAQKNPTNSAFVATNGSTSNGDGGSALSTALASNNGTIYPGLYCTNLTVTGHGLTLSPTGGTGGAFIVVGQFGTSGGSAGGTSANSSGCSGTGGPWVNGNGVTVYVYQTNTGSSGLASSAGGCVDITAPSTDTYTAVSGCTNCGNAGLALWFAQIPGTTCSHSSPQETFSGSAIAAITGALYSPCNPVTYSGSSGSTPSTCTQLIGWTIYLTGSATLNHNCAGTGISDVYASGGSSTAIKVVQ